MNHRLPTFRACAAAVMASLSGQVLADCDFESAMHQLGAGDPAAQQTLLQCADNPNHGAEANFHLAVLLRTEQDLPAALDRFDLALAAQPDESRILMEKAVTLEWSGETAEAESIYRSVIDAEPDNLSARLGLARMLHWQGDLGGSLAIYEDLSGEFPGHRGVETGHAFALLGDSQLRRSAQLFASLQDRFPEDQSVRDGLRMLEDIRQHRIALGAGYIRNDSGNDTGDLSLSYRYQSSYRWQWGIELVENREFTILPEQNSIPGNRSLKSSWGASANLRLSPETSLYGAWKHQQLASGQYQDKLQLEMTHAPSSSRRIMLGVVPSRIGGETVSTLGYAGFQFNVGNGLSPMIQLYHNADREFQDSNALSASLSFNYGERNYGQVGLSVSRTGETEASSMFANVTHHLNRDFAVSVGGVTNFDTGQDSLYLGLVYEF